MGCTQIKTKQQKELEELKQGMAPELRSLKRAEALRQIQLPLNIKPRTSLLNQDDGFNPTLSTSRRAPIRPKLTQLPKEPQDDFNCSKNPIVNRRQSSKCTSPLNQ